RVERWDLTRPEVPALAPLETALGEVTAITDSPDGRWLAIGGLRCGLELWQLSGASPQRHVTLTAEAGKPPFIVKKSEDKPGEAPEDSPVTGVSFEKDSKGLQVRTKYGWTWFVDLGASVPRRLTLPKGLADSNREHLRGVVYHDG